MAEWPESRISQGSGFVSARDIGCLSLWGVLTTSKFISNQVFGDMH